MHRTTLLHEDHWKLRAEATWGTQPLERISSHCAPRTISCGGRWPAVQSWTRPAAC